LAIAQCLIHPPPSLNIRTEVCVGAEVENDFFELAPHLVGITNRINLRVFSSVPHSALCYLGTGDWALGIIALGIIALGIIVLL
jgi:hypothetical protein